MMPSALTCKLTERICIIVEVARAKMRSVISDAAGRNQCSGPGFSAYGCPQWNCSSGLLLEYPTTQHRLHSDASLGHHHRFTVAREVLTCRLGGS